MNYQLKQNKVLKTLKLKKSSRKTHPGKKGGWLLDCEVAEISNLANSIISLPFLFPRGSCATYIHLHEKFSAYTKGIMKGNKPLNSFTYEPNKVKPKVKEKLSKKTKRTEPDWDELEEPGPECPGSLCFECDSSSCVCDIIFCPELEEPEEQDDIDQETKDHD